MHYTISTLASSSFEADALGVWGLISVSAWAIFARLTVGELSPTPAGVQ